MLITRFIVILFIIMQFATLSAEQAQKTPILTDYGPVFAIKDRAIPLPEKHIYKAVFDVSTTSSDPQDYSRRLESVARFINMHALNGVALEKMQLAVVIHGKAVKDSLVNSKYQLLYQLDNPNQQLIEQLHNKGVKFYICGQSTAFLGYKKADLLAPVQLALSAMTQLVVLQNEGYALLP